MYRFLVEEFYPIRYSSSEKRRKAFPEEAAQAPKGKV